MEKELAQGFLLISGLFLFMWLWVAYGVYVLEFIFQTNIV